jgi:hypothetical protein
MAMYGEEITIDENNKIYFRCPEVCRGHMTKLDDNTLCINGTTMISASPIDTRSGKEYRNWTFATTISNIGDDQQSDVVSINCLSLSGCQDYHAGLPANVTPLIDEAVKDTTGFSERVFFTNDDGEHQDFTFDIDLNHAIYPDGIDTETAKTYPYKVVRVKDFRALKIPVNTTNKWGLLQDKFSDDGITSVKSLDGSKIISIRQDENCFLQFSSKYSYMCLHANIYIGVLDVGEQVVKKGFITITEGSLEESISYIKSLS